MTDNPENPNVKPDGGRGTGAKPGGGTSFQLANCDRCGRQLRVAESRREESKPFRLAKAPKGVCPECVMTQFLYNTYPINMQIDEAGAELLLKPMIAEAFVASGLMDGCDMDISEVNWQRVVDNWKLPVDIAKKNPMNPYRMGDSKRQKEAMKSYRAGFFTKGVR